MRVRGNSFSLQMDLECVELGTTTEVNTSHSFSSTFYTLFLSVLTQWTTWSILMIAVGISFSFHTFLC